MAVVTAVSNGLGRTAALPDYNATYTTMFWCIVDGEPGVEQVFTTLASAADYDGFGRDGTTAVLGLFVPTGSATGSALAASTWAHLALVRASATDCRVYLNGVSDFVLTTNVGTARAAPTNWRIGVDERGAQGLIGRFAGIKAWDAALTATEIQQEMQTLRPQRFANLNLWDPGFPGSGERVRDYSGNGRDWTEVGTPTDGDPPPVSYGAPGLQVLPPFQVAAPASDVTVGGWTTPPLWSKVDAPVPDDTTAIQSSVNPAADQAELALSPLVDPTRSDGHTVRYRIRLVS